MKTQGVYKTTELKASGFHGVKMVISDGHRGIRGAVERCFLGASWQMCHVHFIRNIMKVIPKKSWGDVVDATQLALNDPARLNDARTLLERKEMTRAVDMFDRFQDSLHSYSAFPKGHWRRLRTSNMLERINLELKRRTRKIGALPDDRSLLRLAVSILMNIDEEWHTGRRYLNPYNASWRLCSEYREDTGSGNLQKIMYTVILHI